MLLLSLLGCGGENLSQAWEIDRLRILAIAAEPAEPRPGDSVTFDALIVDPTAEVGGSVWFACAAEVSSSLGCEIDPALLDPGVDPAELDYEALVAAGFLGFLPTLPPTWTVPVDWLDGLSEAERLEGSFAMLYVTAFPGVEEGEEFDEEDLEISYKRVPVSEALTPNHNPAVACLRIDGHDVFPGSSWIVEPGQSYELDVVLDGDSVEAYTYRTDDGVDEARTEEPWFSWFLQEGTFDQTATLWPYTTVTWTAPEAPTLAAESLWVVVRDRRGGMGWAELKLAFAD